MAEMRPAAEMKDSGIEWIGEIPKDWIAIQLKNVIDYNLSSLPENTAPDFEFDYIDIGSVTYGKGIEEYQRMKFIDAPTRARRIVNQDDVILSTVRTYLKAVAAIPYREVPVIVSTGFLTMTAKKRITPKFLFYTVQSDYFVDDIEANSNGISYPAINASSAVRRKIVLPPLSEQQAIADYLDDCCSKIDEIINEATASIEEYKELKQAVIFEAVTKGLDKDVPMKDSGIKSVGSIPAHWLINKMNRICNVITDYVASGSFASLAENVIYLDDPDYAMLVRTADISGKSYSMKKVYVSKESYDFLHNSNLFGGEIILPNIGASVGDVYMVPKLYKHMTLAPNAIMLKTNQIDEYYYYLFKCNAGRDLLIDIAQSTAQAKFNKTELRQLRLPQPPKEEQMQIVRDLAPRVKEIDSLIDEKNELVEDLQAYKKSLIYEVVTGKRRVV